MEPRSSHFSPKQSKTDEESITSKYLQVHAKLQPTYCIFFIFKKNFRDCFLSLHPLQNSHTSSNKDQGYKLLCNTWKATFWLHKYPTLNNEYIIYMLSQAISECHNLSGFFQAPCKADLMCFSMSCSYSLC